MTVTGTNWVTVDAAMFPLAGEVAVTVITAEPGATAVTVPSAAPGVGFGETATTVATAGLFEPKVICGAVEPVT